MKNYLPLWKRILLCFCPTHVGFDVEGDVAYVCYAKILFGHICIIREDMFDVPTGNLIRRRQTMTEYFEQIILL